MTIFVAKIYSTLFLSMAQILLASYWKIFSNHQNLGQRFSLNLKIFALCFHIGVAHNISMLNDLTDLTDFDVKS